MNSSGLLPGKAVWSSFGKVNADNLQGKLPDHLQTFKLCICADTCAYPFHEC